MPNCGPAPDTCKGLDAQKKLVILCTELDHIVYNVLTHFHIYWVVRLEDQVLDELLLEHASLLIRDVLIEAVLQCLRECH